MLERQQWIGIAAFPLVVLGTFMPIADLGYETYGDLYGNGGGDGVFVLGLGVISVAILFARQYRWLMIVAIAIAAIWLLTALRLHATMAVRPGAWVWWGWLPLVAGTAAMFTAGLSPRR